MSDLPYTDESGRAILKIFGERKVRANEILMAGAVQHAFLSNQQFRAEDYAAGLSYGKRHPQTTLLAAMPGQ